MSKPYPTNGFDALGDAELAFDWTPPPGRGEPIELLQLAVWPQDTGAEGLGASVVPDGSSAEAPWLGAALFPLTADAELSGTFAPQLGSDDLGRTAGGEDGAPPYGVGDSTLDLAWVAASGAGDGPAGPAEAAGSGHAGGGADGGVIVIDAAAEARGGNGGGGGGSGGGGDPNLLATYVSGDPGGYNIEITFKGTWTSALQQAFIDSSEQISDIIIGDVADVFFRGKIIDDIRITAELRDIDGEGGVLGQAGATAVRTSNYLPATAAMQFDIADAAALNSEGLWNDTVIHEMFHCIGFGSIWDLKGLVAGSGTDTPLFTGAEATAAYEAIFGVPSASGVPLEQDGGSGTVESHWDEETFANEIMTGYIDGTNYVSNMTVASLTDLGYATVPWTSVDPFLVT